MAIGTDHVGGRGVKTLILVAAVASALALAPPLLAEEALDWRLPAFSNRLAITVPREAGETVLVSLQVSPPAAGSLAVLDAEGAPVPFRPVFTETNRVVLQLRSAGARKGRQGAVYHGPAPVESAVAPDPGLQDSRPVRHEARQAGGQGIPNTWAKMLYLFMNGDEGESGYCAELDGGDYAARGERKRGHEGGWIVRRSTMLLCPTGGLYRFAIDCRNAGFVFVDGAMATSWPGEHDGGSWQQGDPVALTAGPHALEAYGYARGEFRLRVAWQPPGVGEMAPIPREAMIAGMEVDESRTERKGQTLQAGFTCDVQPAYAAFTGEPEGSRPSVTFIPVRFTDRSMNSLGVATRSVWDLGDGSVVTGPSPLHIYLQPGLFEVQQDVRDTLGFSAQCRQPVDCRWVQPREYALRVTMDRLPPIVYGDEIVAPRLEVGGQFVTRFGVDLRWECRPRVGRNPDMDRAEQTVASDNARIRIVTTNAAALSDILWACSHKGGTLKRGRVRFLTPPFDTLPERVVGDRLLDADGNQLVLVPARWPGNDRPRPISKQDLAGGIHWVGDSIVVAPAAERLRRGLADGERLAGADRKTPVAFYAVSGVSGSAGEPARLSELREVMQSTDGATGGVWVVCLGLRSFLSHEDPLEFEKEVAVLADILSATRGRALILATPPPYPPEPDAVRPYAAAVLRAATARGIPTADLYSTLRAVMDKERLFVRNSDLALNERGVDLAVQALRAAVAAGGSEGAR